MKILFITNSKEYFSKLKKAEQFALLFDNENCSYNLLKEINQSEYSNIVFLTSSFKTNIVCNYRLFRSLNLVNIFRNILKTDNIIDYSQFSYKHAFLLKHINKPFCVLELDPEKRMLFFKHKFNGS